MKKYYTWEDIQTALHNRFNPKSLKASKIVAITRGGLFVAGMIAELTGLRHIDTLCFDSYNGEKKDKVKVIKAQYSNEPVLLVDDVCDTGETLLIAQSFYPSAHSFTLHYKPKTAKYARPEQYIWETEDWIVYPWEIL